MVFLINKCSDAAYQFAIVVFQYPADDFCMAERLVFLFVENLVNIFIKGAYVIGIVSVNNQVNLKKSFTQVIIRNLRQLHVGFLANVVVIFFVICSGFNTRTLPLHPKLKALYLLN
jgi:hypothetical protein